MKAFSLSVLLACSAAAVEPNLGGPLTIGGFTHLPAIELIPSNTNSVRGGASLIFGGHSVGNQLTNSENVWIIWGINVDRAGNVIDTNHHALCLVAEMNWDDVESLTGSPSSSRNVEYYTVFIARSNAWSQRIDGWVLGDTPDPKSQAFKYTSQFSLGHPRRMNEQGVFFSQLNIPNGGTRMNIRGSITVDTNSTDAATIYVRGSGTSGGYVSLANKSNDKYLTLIGDGNGFEQYGVGLDGQALIWAGQNILRIMAAKQILMSTNLTVFGDVASSNVITKGLTFSGTMTACPTNPLTPTKWLPFTNNGARYYLPAYQ